MRIPYRKPGVFSQMKQDPLLTADKLEEIKKKLEKLKDAKPFAMAEVSRLAELGDFSENVEYQMAKGKLRGINGGIFNLQNQIDNAVLIENSGEVDKVCVGNTVTVEMNGKEKTFKVLGSVESDPTNGIISHNSPVGTALMDKTVGQEFEIEREAGNIKCKIISISNI